MIRQVGLFSNHGYRMIGLFNIQRILESVTFEQSKSFIHSSIKERIDIINTFYQ